MLVSVESRVVPIEAYSTRSTGRAWLFGFFPVSVIDIDTGGEVSVPTNTDTDADADTNTDGVKQEQPADTDIDTDIDINLNMNIYSILYE